MAYVECIDDMMKPMAKREVEAIILILTEVRNSYKALTSST